MRIKTVNVNYGEGRVCGSDRAWYSVGYEAEVFEEDATDTGDAAQVVHGRLMERAIRAVKLLHGDTVEDVQLKICVSKCPF